MIRRHSTARGFTLIELMIAVAVVALLVAIAYPSYTRQIQKSRRADAKSALLACAQALERYNTQSGSYTAGTDAGVNSACVGATPNGYYTLPTANIPTAAGASTFSLRATPSGTQSADACGSFTYTQDAVKGVTGGTLPSSSCW